MAMEVTQILLNSQSVDGNVHKLAYKEKLPETRRLAGLILEKPLDAKEAARKEELLQGWVSLDPDLKDQIKNSLLQTLSSSVPDARHTSSQVIAKIAAIEVPRQEWPELIGILLANMGGPQVEKLPTLKQATLETLGYVCEDISSDVFAQDQVNSIKTVVAQGMNATEDNNDVLLAATKALYIALVDYHNEKQDQMFVSYGMGYEGSLRFIRNGVSVEKSLSTPPIYQGVPGTWTMRLKRCDSYHSFLVISLIQETRVLSVSFNFLDITDAVRFQPNDCTLACGLMEEGRVVQVCRNEVRLCAPTTTAHRDGLDLSAPLRMAVVTILFADLGFMSPTSRGMLLTQMILLYLFLGIGVGYGGPSKEIQLGGDLQLGRPIFLVTGTIGFLTSFYFICYLFSSVKID
eukprot:Gb_37870 [translate_table: standard]